MYVHTAAPIPWAGPNVRPTHPLSRDDCLDMQGMLHEMVNGLWERHSTFDSLPPLATIPAGTGNGALLSTREGEGAATVVGRELALLTLLA